MKNFDFCSRTRIVFGKDCLEGLGPRLRACKVLVVSGQGSVRRSGIYAQLIDELESARTEYAEFVGVEPNPTLDQARQAVIMARWCNADFILAVGGGSVIDLAKAAAVGVPYPGDVWDLFDLEAEMHSALPLGVILTMPGSGSESSDSCVITNRQTMQKFGYHSPVLRPQFALIDPSYFFTLSDEQIGNAVCDMFCHVMERYFSGTRYCELTQELSEGVMRTILHNAPRVQQNHRDYDAWAEIALCNNLAHNGLLGVGKVGEWAAHAIEHELSARYDVAHGKGLAVIFPAWMQYVYTYNPRMFQRFAYRVMDVAPSGNSDADMREGIARLNRFFSSLGLPDTLRALGVDEADIPAMAAGATTRRRKPRPLGRIRELGAQDVEAIYRSAL